MNRLEKNSFILFLVAIAILVAFFVGILFFGVHLKADTAQLYKVIRVPDGDTLIIGKPCKSVKGELCAETVRLIGVDAAEMPFFGKEEQCYAREAKQELIDLAIDLSPDGIILERHGKDKFGRTLGYIFTPLTAADPSGKLSRLRFNSVNYFLIKNGYAKSFRAYPHKYTKDYNAAEEWAKVNNQGLWIACQRKSFGGKW